MRRLKAWIEWVRQRGLFGVVLVYVLSTWVAYQGIWQAIEPLGVPDAIEVGGDPVSRTGLHFLLADLVGAHLALLACLLVFRSPSRFKVVEAKLQTRQVELTSREHEIAQLEREVESLTREREILRLGVRMLHEEPLSDREITAMKALAFAMRPSSRDLSAQGRLDVIKAGLEIACADKNLRPLEERAIRDAAREQGIDAAAVDALLEEARARYAG